MGDGRATVWTSTAPAGAPADAAGTGHPPPRPRRRGRRLAAGGLLVLALAVAGLGVDLWRAADAAEGLLLPGTVIAGVDVGGLTVDAARARVQATLDPQLDEVVAVTWQDRRWERTRRGLGAITDLEAQLAAAAHAAQHAGWWTHARIRYLDHRPELQLPITVADPAGAPRALARDLARELDREPVDARLGWDEQRVWVTPSRPGRAVDVDRTAAAVAAAIAGGGGDVPLHVEDLAPSVTTADYDQILFLRQRDHRLDLYLDGRRTATYVVATGTGRYPTPTGVYEVNLKRFRPTWVNPDPSGWGRGLPARIGPGPNNPLGLRALNWSAPGAIRFHGTAAVSSLGRDASHGCVRLSNPDVIDLFDRVDEGATIISIR